MKINIQNLEHDLIEVDGEVGSTFPEGEMREAYPDKQRVHIILDHFGKDYRVDVHVKTRGHYVCDRCLTAFTRELAVDQRQIFHIGEERMGDDPEIISLPVNSTELDLTPMIRETIWLNHPLKLLCAEDCKGLCHNCGANLNTEQCSCPENPGDPRWASLRKLIK
jgi:uncharacterized protein